MAGVTIMTGIPPKRKIVTCFCANACFLAQKYQMVDKLCFTFCQWSDCFSITNAE
jgi:hypothetical protein